MHQFRPSQPRRRAGASGDAGSRGYEESSMEEPASLVSAISAPTPSFVTASASPSPVPMPVTTAASMSPPTPSQPPTFEETTNAPGAEELGLGELLSGWGPIVLLAAASTIASTTEGGLWPSLSSAFLLAGGWLGFSRLRTRIQRAENEYLKKLRQILSHPARRAIFDQGPEPFEWVKPDRLRPGEEVVVRVGEYLVVDGSVVEGTATVTPWLGAGDLERVGVGTRVAAGARVDSGLVRVVCSKTGSERALAPLVGEGVEALSTRAFPSRLHRRLCVLGALAAGALGGLLIWLQGGSYTYVLSVMGAIWGALALPLSISFPKLYAQRELNSVAREGVSFPHQDVLDAAGAVSSTVFCARGTVLHGEPEVAEIHSFRESSESRLLSLAAGAESVAAHPIATAITRAAALREVTPDASRSHDLVPGMGVLCVSSAGRSLVCGSRELLLRERISIALAEETLRNLESRGLTALLIAEESHLVGVLALQDSLRVGAKAAVQLLLDAGIEPVILSGDSRATTEAVARALCVEHVRPEVPAGRRAEEVRNLIEGGASVAVIGTSPRDDSALGAGQVPVVLEGATTSRGDSPHPHERSVGLIGVRVITAVHALLTARRIRHFGQTSVALTFLPVFVAASATASQLGPVFLAPVVSVFCLGVSLVLYRRADAGMR